MDIEEQRGRPSVEETPGEAAERAAEAARAERWGKLPERVAPADRVEELPADPPNDPEFGRDANNDWLLRSAP